MKSLFMIKLLPQEVLNLTLLLIKVNMILIHVALWMKFVNDSEDKDNLT